MDLLNHVGVLLLLIAVWAVIITFLTLVDEVCEGDSFITIVGFIMILALSFFIIFEAFYWVIIGFF